MKRRTVILKRILPCIAALLVLANCKNLFQPPEPPPAQTGEGTFSLEIGGIRAGRTILPAAVKLSFAAYTLVFKAEGKTDVSADRTNANLGQAIPLPAGTWNLTVTAFMDSGKTKPAAQGSITAIEISGGGNTSRSLELTPLIEAGAAGTFKWNIVYPADVTRASMAITPLDEETGTAAQTLYFVGGETVTDKNNAAAPLALKTGYYRVVFNLSMGAIETGRVEYLHIYKNLESSFEYVFTQGHFAVNSVVSEADSGPGSLRYAIEKAEENSTILVEVETINLDSRLNINKNLTIRGNGVTLTQSAAWTDLDNMSSLLYINTNAITVNISRVHFKNGRATTLSSTVSNYGRTVNLESCIFSGNHASGGYGGAISNRGTMSVKGCTFYNNSSASGGGAIYHSGSGILTLTGNLFYGNTGGIYGGPVVYGEGEERVTSNGWNVADVDLGTGDTESGWTAATGDKTVNKPLITPLSFKLLNNSEAANVITTLPEGYPHTDFYGDAIGNGAAVGAVQSTISGSGYYLELGVNNSSWGSISSTPAPDADGLVPAGTVTLTASPAEGYGLNWLVNGSAYGSTNPLSITGNAIVQAVFGKLLTVTDFTDTAGSATREGTLRYALTNAQDGEIIGFTGVTAGTTTIELGSKLEISKNVTIEGNGVTLTRSAAWTESNDSSQLLRINNSSAAITVNISQVHFKNGSATTNGAAIYNNGETVNLESCIFSGNQTSAGTAQGGAIYTSGFMSVKGCTFYNNSSASQGGAIYNTGSTTTLTLTGNLFYGNTAGAYGGAVVYRDTGTVTSNGYNATNVALGTENTQSGWTAATGDKTVNKPLIMPLSFKLLHNSEAANVITTLPEGYPHTDFYGDAIGNGAAVGAVQSTISGSGYYLELRVNNSSWGSISSTPDADGLVPAGTVTLTASPAEGYGLNWLVNGSAAGSTNPLSLTITGNTTVQAVFARVVTDFSDASGSENTPGTLRYVLTNAQDGEIIRFTGVTAENNTIALGSALPQITKNITIEGNGVTLTPGAGWTSNASSHLLTISNYSAAITVNISRVHFKNGRATTSGAAILNSGETVNLESCIFSGNQTSAGTANAANGGAIYNNGTMSVKGCTFYNNSSESQGGAIYNAGSTTTLTLTGNLFYGNTAAANGGPVVYNYYSVVTSNGYNATDVALGTGTTESGWTSAAGDKTVTNLPISLSFKLLNNSEAANVITTLPAGYPHTDFYGEAIADGAAAGAVQSTVSGSGYCLELGVNNSSWGSISSTPAPDADGLVSGTVTLTASPAAGYGLVNWLVNETAAGSTNPLSRDIDGHTTVQAVFARLVTDFNDASTPGTLRYALTNAQNGDIIWFTGVTAGTTTIELGSALPQVTKSVTIEGNGVTLTRSAAWTATSTTSQLLYIYNSSAAITVNISRVHFKNGRATTNGAAIYNNAETVNLESCIFSGNQTGTSTANGGAICNAGTMSVKGCTFYNNSATNLGGAIYNTGSSTRLTLTGNLFYGNTAEEAGPVVYRSGGTVTSNGYNATNVALGTGNTQSGWTAVTGDKTVTKLPISLSFKLLNNSEAANVITTLPAGYPQTDFYGDTIGNGAAAGAVQSTVGSNRYFLDLSVNNSSRGSISSTPAPDAEGLVSAGTVALTVSPLPGHSLAYWLVNGDKNTGSSPLNLTISNNTVVQAVFSIQVTDFSDASTLGTLRYALTNAQDGDIIPFTGVTAGTTIELGSVLPQVSKSVTIEGNGVTLTRSATWTTTASYSQLLYILNSSAAITVNISRVHFKNGRETSNGAAVRNHGETVNLESCIFSGNQISGSIATGGAIYNDGTMNVKGCTFYNNSSADRGGTISNASSSTLTLTGNLFYGNTAAANGYPVVYQESSGTVTSNGYNVVDVDLGTGGTQSGWTAGTGDKTFTQLGIGGDPFNTTTFAPVTGLNGVLPSTALTDFPAADFNGATRTWPGAPGAVK